jgi:hypothetical protein
MGEELTGARRIILSMAWWIVAVSGAWMLVFSPMVAYSLSPHCNPGHISRANAGNPMTMILGFLAVVAALRVLRRRTIATSTRLAAVMMIALPLAFIEWIVMYMQLSHRCGQTVTAAWFAAPTRDATVVVAFSGPVLLVLACVLAWRERRSSSHLATARALADRS